MIDKYMSGKLRIVSFFAMILVVFRHAYNLGEEVNIAKKTGYSFFMQVFISSGFTSIAVPVFFVISGYLLFLNKKQSFIGYKLILSKRFSSLVIPYLFWTISWLLFYLFKDIFLTKHCTDCTFEDFLINIFITPIPLQFWFIRDLFILVVLSPIIYYLIKFSRGLILVVFAVIWFLNLLIPLNESIALLFFAIGSFLGINEVNINIKSSVNYGRSFIILWLFTIYFQTLFIYITDQNVSVLKIIQNNFFLNALDKIGILIGLFGVWSFYDILFKDVDVQNLKWFSLTEFSFFIFAFHLPILWIIPHWFYGLVGKNNFSMLIYILASTVLIIFSLLLGKYLKRIMPILFGIITGGR